MQCAERMSMQLTLIETKALPCDCLMHLMHAGILRSKAHHPESGPLPLHHALP